MHRYNHVTADQHPAFESLSAQYEPEVVSLARKVVQETILTEGSGDLEYPFKAARAISKTIRKFNKMAEFQEAIYSADANTSCCMVQNEKRSFGRILIFSLKIFRFPWIRVDLEVRSSPACRNPYRRKSPMVCINPYHYNNVEVPSRPLPPVLINKNHDYSRPSLLFPETSGMDPVDVALLDNVPDPTDWKTIPNVTMRGDELRQVYVDLAQNQQLDIGSPTSTIMSPTSANAAHQYPSNISSPASNPPEYAYNYDTMADAEINETPFSYRPMYEEEDGTWQPPRFAEDSFCGDGASTSRQPQRHFIYEPSPMQLALTQPSRKRHLDDENEDEDTIRSKIRSGDYELVEFQEPGNWVTLVYYEEGVQCVKPCDVHSQYFLVDGFTCSTTDKDNRLSLGYLNNVRRSKDISEFRNLISRGIRLYYLGGEVFLECLGEFPIFVQTLSANLTHGFHLNTVSKVLPGRCNMKIFNNAQFAEQLALAAEKSYQDVYSLSRMCTIRMSFFKGWGDSYKRSNVLMTPCWIEAHLNGPLQWIDRVLTCMRSPSKICSSFT